MRRGCQDLRQHRIEIKRDRRYQRIQLVSGDSSQTEPVSQTSELSGGIADLLAHRLEREQLCRSQRENVEFLHPLLLALSS